MKSSFKPRRLIDYIQIYIGEDKSINWLFQKENVETFLQACAFSLKMYMLNEGVNIDTVTDKKCIYVYMDKVLIHSIKTEVFKSIKIGGPLMFRLFCQIGNINEAIKKLGLTQQIIKTKQTAFVTAV